MCCRSFITFSMQSLGSLRILCTLIVSALTSGVALATLHLLSLSSQLVRSKTPLQSIPDLLPFCAAFLLASLLCSYLLPRSRMALPWFSASSLFISIGACVMLQPEAQTSPARNYVAAIFIGAGSGLSWLAPIYICRHRSLARVISFLPLSYLTGSLFIVTLSVSQVYRDLLSMAALGPSPEAIQSMNTWIFHSLRDRRGVPAYEGRSFAASLAAGFMPIQIAGLLAFCISLAISLRLKHAQPAIIARNIDERDQSYKLSGAHVPGYI